MARFIHVTSTASTNSYTARMAAMLPSGTVIHTQCQSAGYGQRGTSWESEDGKNITFSMLVKGCPLPPARQFLISEATALAVVDTLNGITPGFCIKWPNDIYYADRKVAGILIEHAVTSSAILHTIIGVGLNVNQDVFRSDAPNPVSLKQITGSDYDCGTLLHDVCQRIERYCDFSTDASREGTAMHEAYLRSLYRLDGQQYRFELADGTPIEAEITGVRPDGTLCLLHNDGTEGFYAFKEVKYVI